MAVQSNVVDDDNADDSINDYPYGEYSTIAYWIPLWAGIYPPPMEVNPNQLYEMQFVPWTYEPSEHIKNKLVRSLNYSGLVQVAGVLITTLPTGQQWDSPNAWPPLVLLTIEGLRNLGSTNALVLAVRVLLYHCYCCY